MFHREVVSIVPGDCFMTKENFEPDSIDAVTDELGVYFQSNPLRRRKARPKTKDTGNPTAEKSWDGWEVEGLEGGICAARKIFP